MSLQRRTGTLEAMLNELYVDHLVFRVGDLGATRAFYSAFLGEPPYEDDESVMYVVGETKNFFHGPH